MANHHIEPHIFVVLGATSDLMSRKLLPALYHLQAQGYLKERLILLGTSRRADLNDESFRVLAQEAVAEAGLFKEVETPQWCQECLYYQPLEPGKSEDFQALAARLRPLPAM